MKTVCYQIEPKTEFSSAIKGDTLFAFMCCFIADLYGEARLDSLLDGYTENKPFMVVSDLFPQGLLPRPTLPANVFLNTRDKSAVEKRKEFKKRNWIAREHLMVPVSEWQKASDEGLLQKGDYQAIYTRTHNSVNPRTGQVDGEQYAPYTMRQISYSSLLDVYITFDEARISADEIATVLTNIGLCGIGKGATRGLGKFEVGEKTEIALPKADSCCYMTLAPCVPQKNQDIIAAGYYKLFTRFGRQFYFRDGQPKNPFKAPVLTADTGAVFCTKHVLEKPFLGCGVSDVSLDKKVVYQGYAPVYPLNWSAQNDE